MTPRPSTFSIVARDPEQDAVGVAVQSKFVSVGSVVPFVSADAGAIATQSFANVAYGPDGLDLLREGRSAEEVVSELTDADDEAPSRQVGVVGADGSIAAFTGDECFDVAGDIQGENYTVQGNILENEATLDSMAEAFETTEGGLPERLLAALHAGNDAGGDKRGEQSAAMYIAKPEGGYDGGNDRWVDVRVDDHDRPIAELERVFKLYDITLLEREAPAETKSLSGETAEAVLETLSNLGFYDGTPSGEFDDEAVAALESFRGMNNFENHSLSVLEDAIARGWDEVDGESESEGEPPGEDDATDELDGETKLIEAIWQGLSRLDRK
ncbi:DUF1028 domain-containing protein [Haloferax chudinovii]|uniref:DUF1028 domain-containing protein n=1 Tax=Haloferax chudinovii TaxID=1109010 RepID=A0ABD5X9V7_9EURY